MTSNLPGIALNDQVEDIIIRLAAATLGRKASSIKPNDPFFSSQAGFDSFSLMEFVLRLEDTFGINIPNEHLDPDIFYSVKTVASYLCAQLNLDD